MNFANKLTLLRIVLVPFFMLFIFVDSAATRVLALLIFIGASLTDLYDGKLARENNCVTDLGKFMDPLADKLLVSAAFISFVELKEINIPAWMVIIIISREFIITGLRTVAASQGHVLAAGKEGKYKTTSQMVSIVIVLLIITINALYKNGSLRLPIAYFELEHLIRGISYYLMLITTILTATSGISFIVRYRHFIKEK